MLRTGYRFLLITAITSPLLWAAWFLWQDETYAVDTSEFDISEPQTMTTLPLLIRKPLKHVLSNRAENPEIDTAVLIKIVEKYRQRRPLDPQGWLWASELSKLTNNNSDASRFFSVAHSLSRNSGSMLMKVFNRYLELGLVDEAIPVAHDLVFAQPERFRSLFYLLSRLTNDYSALVEKMIPQRVPSYGKYAPDLYYSWALNDAVRAKNKLLAHALWSKIPSKFKQTSGYGLNYLNFLVGSQNWDDVPAVWHELTGKAFDSGDILQADFETQMHRNSPCWQSTPIPGAAWSYDSNAFEGSSSLRLEFDGNENINFNHLACHVSVEPGQSYKLSGMWAGRGISTLSGPYVDVFSQNSKGVYVRSEQMLGNWPWLSFELNINVPHDIEVVTIRIRRNKTDLIDSKISGHVWFDDFKMVKQTAENELEKTYYNAEGT